MKQELRYGSFEVGLGLLDEGYRVAPAERAEFLLQSHAKLWVNWRDVGALYAEWRFPLLEQEYPIDVGLLQLTRAPRLSVIVVDAQGEPLARATLVTSVGKARTDEVGRADLNSAPGDELFILAAGYKLGRFQTDDLRPGPDGIQRLSLEPGVMLSLSLSQERQQELGSESQIQLAWSQAPFEEAPYVAFDSPAPYYHRLRKAFDAGHFKRTGWSFAKPGQPGETHFELPGPNPLLIPGLKPGGQLQVRLVDVLGQKLAELEVTLPSSAGTRSIALDDLPISGAPLEVHIRDADGHPLSNASLFVSSVETGSGSRIKSVAGRIESGLLRLGKYKLTADAKGYISRCVAGHELSADSSPVEFLLERSRSLSFQVLDESGETLRVDQISAEDGAGWAAPTQYPKSPGPVNFTLPLRPIEISFQIGTRHRSQWIAPDSSEDSMILPVHGTLLIEFNQRPRTPWEEARVRVEISDGHGKTVLRGRFRESGSGGLRLMRTLQPGTYTIDVHLERETDQASEPGPKSRLLHTGEVVIQAAQTTRLDPSLR